MSVDVYAEVTDRIVSALEAGTVPWRRPWVASQESHRNPVSGTEYRGVNPFLLEMTAMEAGYGDPRWVTFRQAKKIGGSVRKGERSTLVIFWKMLKGKDKVTGELKTIPLLRNYRVFNVAQCDGLELAELATPEVFDSVKCAEDVIAGMPSAPTMRYGGDRAFYHPAMDHVQLPHRAQFLAAEGFYCTAFHELAHSTGHASRLNRPEVAGKTHHFGDESYAREELTAEMTAAMLAATCGMAPQRVEEDRSAAYIKGWLKALQDDPKMVVAAAGRAQRAADFIRNVKREVK